MIYTLGLNINMPQKYLSYKGFIYRLPHDCHLNIDRTQKAIHIRLHPNKINRDIGVEIPNTEWIPTIRTHSHHNGPLREQFPPIIMCQQCFGSKPTSEVRDTPVTNKHGGTKSPTQ